MNSQSMVFYLHLHAHSILITCPHLAIPKPFIGLLNSERKKAFSRDVSPRDAVESQKGHFLKMLRLQETNETTKVYCKEEGTHKVDLL